MEKIVILVIVTVATLFILRNFYGKLKNEGNPECGCACDSSKNMGCRPSNGNIPCPGVGIGLFLEYFTCALAACENGGQPS